MKSDESAFAELEKSARDKEKLLLERSKRMEMELLEATSKLQSLDAEKTKMADEMKKRLEERTAEVARESGLKLSIAERRAMQAESELLKIKQQLRQREEEAEQKKGRNHALDQSKLNFKIDPLKTERSEPIGAERDDDRNSDIMSLEQIITSPNRAFSISQRSESLAPQSDAAEQLKKLEAKFEHANSVLHETEATNARLTEQTGLLKNEIRRLEKNQERQDLGPIDFIVSSL